MGLKCLPVLWAEPAEDSLATLLEYIGVENPEASRCLLAKIQEALEKASIHPKMYRFIPEMGHTYREIVSVRPFRVIYQMSETHLRVMAVLRTEQAFDPARFLTTDSPSSAPEREETP